MKRIILVRHAKSSWQEPALEDIERPLKHRGERDAPVIGQRLKERDIKPDLMISSPATRAIDTARLIAKEIGYPVKKIVIDSHLYAHGPDGILNAILTVEDKFDEIMLFGHNPDITTLAARFTAQFNDDMPTCGVVCIDFDVESWAVIGDHPGALVFFDYPKKID